MNSAVDKSKGEGLTQNTKSDCTLPSITDSRISAFLKPDSGAIGIVLCLLSFRFIRHQVISLGDLFWRSISKEGILIFLIGASCCYNCKIHTIFFKESIPAAGSGTLAGLARCRRRRSVRWLEAVVRLYRGRLAPNGHQKVEENPESRREVGAKFSGFSPPLFSFILLISFGLCLLPLLSSSCVFPHFHLPVLFSMEDQISNS